MATTVVKANDFGIEHILGAADVPRLTNATIAATIRRHDPDGTSSVPYVSGLSGTHMAIGYTDSTLTEHVDECTFASNSYQAALDTLNALTGGNVEAIDIDGFLVLRNTRQGKNHYLFIQTASTNDGSSLFGFRVFPYPGYSSFSGDISSALSTKIQKNGQGTALLAHGEDLNSAGINRAVASVAEHLGRLLRFQDKEQIGSTEIAISALRSDVGSNHIITPSGSDIDLIRVAIDRRLLPASPDPETASPGSLDQFFNITDSHGADIYFQGGKVKVTGVIYYNPALFNAIDLAHGISSWLPGGPGATAVSIYYSSVGSPTEGQFVSQVNKQAATNITSIDGNIIRCTGATFVTNLVQPGDTCIIQSSTNDIPFNHNGEFIIERVFDETTIAVRPKAKLGTPLTGLDFAEEPKVFTANNRPTSLNYVGLSAGFGQVVVPIGNFLPARNIGYITNLPTSASATILTGGAKLRIASGKLERLADPLAFAKKLTGSAQQVMDFAQSLLTSGHTYSGGNHFNPVTTVDAVGTASPAFHTAFANLDSPKVLWEVQSFVFSGVFSRLYSLGGADFALTINAQTANGSTWTEDVTASDGIRFQISGTQILWFFHAGGSGSGNWVNVGDFELTRSNLTRTLQFGSDTAALVSATVPMLKSRQSGATTGRAWLGSFADTVIPVNLYINQSTNLFEVLINAEWNGTQWTRPNSGQLSAKIEMARSGIRVLTKSTTGTTWTDADGSWDDGIVTAGKFLSSNSNPTSTTAIYNQLHNYNTPKCCGIITLSSNGTVVTPSVTSGFNIASAAMAGSGTSTTTLHITFAAAMANANYAVIISGKQNRSPVEFARPVASNRLTSGVDVTFELSNGNTKDFADLQTPTAFIDFIVVGG